MGNKVSTNISISPELKKEAVDLFKDLGLDLSTAVNMFLTQAVRERGIPFEITNSVLDSDENKAKSKKISVNLSIDSFTKQNAIKLFNKFDISLSTAITLFLQQAVIEQGIPFYITKEVPNEETFKALMEYKEMRNNHEKLRRYSSFKEILEEMHDKKNHKK